MTTNTWAGPLAIEGRATEDGRTIALNALRWEMPKPLVSSDDQAGFIKDNLIHAVGTIEEISRSADGVILGRGYVTGLTEGDVVTIGIDIAGFDYEADVEHETMTFKNAEVVGAMLGRTPSWPECQITVGPELS